MLIACGVICLLFGLVGLVGQLISTLNFPLAQRLGLQEKPEESDPLYAQLELNTARWDLVVIWTMPLAGLLMILGHSWWPIMALMAGSIHLDTAGRETAKVLGLRARGVRVGSARETRLGLIFFGVMALISLWALRSGAAFLVALLIKKDNAESFSNLTVQAPRGRDEPSHQVLLVPIPACGRLDLHLQLFQ